MPTAWACPTANYNTTQPRVDPIDLEFNVWSITYHALDCGTPFVCIGRLLGTRLALARLSVFQIPLDFMWERPPSNLETPE
jgi:hypothetical protein